MEHVLLLIFLMGILGVMIVKKYNENKSLPFSIERLEIREKQKYKGAADEAIRLYYKKITRRSSDTIT